MWGRCSVILLFLSGILCRGVPLFADDLSTLMAKGRNAFRSGSFDDAERYHRLAVVEAERNGTAAQRGEALGDLGGVLLARGHHAEAKAVCLQALEILRNVASKHYLPVLLNNLASLATQREEFKQAESYLAESLRVISEVNPKDPYRARVLNNLGALHYATNDMKRAARDFRQAIDLLERERGPQSTELAPLLTNLGGVYVAEKKWDAANTLFSRALTLSKDSGTGLAAIFDGIGTMDTARRRYAEAQQAFRRSYQVRLEVFGKGHPEVASSAANLATSLSATGEFAEAEDLLKSSLQVYEKTFGSQSLQVVETLEKLMQVLRQTGREEEAELLEARVKDIRFEREHVVQANALR